MKKIYKNKYRSDTIRLKHHDYSHGIYFITICTHKMKNEFGEIVNGDMKLNKYGEIIKTEWLRTSILRNNVQLDNFAIIPNHFHGIISIFDNNEDKGRVVTRKDKLGNKGRDMTRHVSTNRKFSKPVSNSLSSIIGLFKSSCTREIRNTGYKDYKWQSRFYEHIIHSNSEFIKIQNYINENPQKWENDKYYSK